VTAASAPRGVSHGARHGAGEDIRLASLHPHDRERVLTATFTRLLRHQSGDDLAVRVVAVATRPADPTTAGLLALPRTHPLHRRRTLLCAATSGRALAWAESLLVAERLDPHLREPAVHGSAPLGDVLAVADRDRDLLGWLLGVGLPDWAPVAGQPAAGWPTITRTTRIGGGTGPVALVTEWWPAFDPERAR
jgi:chorismate-pyruvate lyase